MKRNSAGNEWNRIYETVPLKELPWYSGKPAKSLIELIRKKEVIIGNALDVCCGAGINAVYLAKNGFDVTGIDISAKAIDYAREKAGRGGIRCKFIAGDVLNFHFPENNFDLVFDRGCYHHMPQKEKPKFARLIYQTLKSGGTYHMICFSDKDKYYGTGVSKEEIKNNFSGYFEIKSIGEATHTEPDSTKRSFYAVIMKKR